MSRMRVSLLDLRLFLFLRRFFDIVICYVLFVKRFILILKGIDLFISCILKGFFFGFLEFRVRVF